MTFPQNITSPHCVRILLLLVFCALSHPLRSQSAIDTVTFQGEHLQQHLFIYRPAGYTPERTYPVLYLLHGVHGNQYDWTHKGGVQSALDSLIACGRVEPLIVVMPYGQIGGKTDSPSAGSMLVCLFRYHRIRRNRLEQSFNEIDRYVSDHYSVEHGAGRRAIAGNSCGARQACNLVKDSSFAACGLFTPVVTTHQLPEEDFQAAEYWVAAGKKDVFFRCQARVFNRKLQKRGNRSVYYNGTHGHTWLSWKEFFILFVERYFPGEQADSNEQQTDSVQTSVRQKNTEN